MSATTRSGSAGAVAVPGAAALRSSGARWRSSASSQPRRSTGARCPPRSSDRRQAHLDRLTPARKRHYARTGAARGIAAGARWSADGARRVSFPFTPPEGPWTRYSTCDCGPDARLHGEGRRPLPRDPQRRSSICSPTSRTVTAVCAAVMWPADGRPPSRARVEARPGGLRLGRAGHDLPRRLRGVDEVVPRACADLGIRDERSRRSSRPSWPMRCAARASRCASSPTCFVARRRVKTVHQLAGIRRAQATAEAAMAVARDMIAECRRSRGRPRGSPSGYLQRARMRLRRRYGAPGAQSASYHEIGEGPLTPGEPVVVDLWPRDRRSRCWADMTRTFVAGGTEPPAQPAWMWRLCRESLDASYALIRAGADGAAVYAASCAPFRGRRLADVAYQSARRSDG